MLDREGLANDDQREAKRVGGCILVYCLICISVGKGDAFFRWGVGRKWEYFAMPILRCKIDCGSARPCLLYLASF